MEEMEQKRQNASLSSEEERENPYRIAPAVRCAWDLKGPD